MLILEREVGQSILITDDIEIKLLRIMVDRIRLGIEAPKYMSIHRKEFLQQMKNKIVTEIKSKQGINDYYLMEDFRK